MDFITVQPFWRLANTLNKFRERVYFLMLIKPPGEVAVPPAKDSSKPIRRRTKREKDVFDVMEGIFGAVILGALE